MEELALVWQEKGRLADHLVEVFRCRRDRDDTLKDNGNPLDRLLVITNGRDSRRTKTGNGLYRKLQFRNNRFSSSQCSSRGYSRGRGGFIGEVKEH